MKLSLVKRWIWMMKDNIFCFTFLCTRKTRDHFPSFFAFINHLPYTDRIIHFFGTMMLQEKYEQNWVTIEVRKTPKCAAVISDSCQNVCGCLWYASRILEQYQNQPLDDTRKELLMTKNISFLNWTKEGKIKIKTCGKGAIELVIKRTDWEKIDPTYFDAQWATIHAILKQILDDSDERHIMYDHWNEALTWSESDNGYLLTLHRGIPKNWLQKIDTILPKD